MQRITFYLEWGCKCKRIYLLPKLLSHVWNEDPISILKYHACLQNCVFWRNIRALSSETCIRQNNAEIEMIVFEWLKIEIKAFFVPITELILVFKPFTRSCTMKNYEVQVETLGVHLIVSLPISINMSKCKLICIIWNR